MGAPGPHPRPPLDFYQRKLSVAEHNSCFRSYHHSDPLFFGRSGRNRFDDPQGRYGVLYAAADPHGAFIETFGQMTGTRTISTGELRQSRLARLTSERKLRLADLTSPGALARLGADSRLFSGGHAIAHLWSRAFYEHPIYTLDGILYPARHDHTRSAFAIFDRGPQLETIESLPWHGPDADRLLLAAILDAYGFDLIETVIAAERKGPGRATDGDQTAFDF